jgi:uncharacterized membrane protein
MVETKEQSETGRIEAFSDGVFAIAITLLVLEIKVPPHKIVESVGLVSSLLSLWPSYLAFLTSFASILVMWVNHHRIFSLVSRTDHAFFYWNGLLLMLVTVVPFPTALLAEYLLHPQARVAASVYAGIFLAIAIAFNRLWKHAATADRLVAQTADRHEVDAITKQYRFGPLLYLGAFALSFVSVWLSVGICLVLAVYFALRSNA